LHSGTGDWDTKRIVFTGVLAFAKDPPRFTPETEPRLLKKLN